MTQVSDFDSILNNIPTVNMGARSANAPLTQSYDKGPDVPLIEATIGDFFDAIVSKYPEREALVVHTNADPVAVLDLDTAGQEKVEPMVVALLGSVVSCYRRAVPNDTRRLGIVFPLLLHDFREWLVLVQGHAGSVLDVPQIGHGHL